MVNNLDVGSATIVSEFIYLTQKCPLVDLEDTKKKILPQYDFCKSIVLEWFASQQLREHLRRFHQIILRGRNFMPPENFPSVVT